MRRKTLFLLLALAACSSSSDPIQPAEPVDDSPLGGDRPVEPLIPATYDAAKPVPLVILLHGYGASGVANDILLGLAGEVDARGFILLRPDGTVDEEGRRFWNATDACCDFWNTGVDDVAYLDGLIAEAHERFAISRVALVGHSNGGYMCHRYACDRASRIQAAAPIAGVTWQDETQCQPDAPVALLQIHGTEDTSVLYEGDAGGGERLPYPGAVETAARWAEYDGCGPTAGPAGEEDFSADVDGAETQISRYSGCDPGGAVELWTMVGESHVPAFNDAWRTAVLDFLLGT